MHGARATDRRGCWRPSRLDPLRQSLAAERHGAVREGILRPGNLVISLRDADRVAASLAMRAVRLSVDQIGNAAITGHRERVEPTVHRFVDQDARVVRNMLATDGRQLQHVTDQLAGRKLSRRLPRMQIDMRLLDPKIPAERERLVARIVDRISFRPSDRDNVWPDPRHVLVGANDQLQAWGCNANSL